MGNKNFKDLTGKKYNMLTVTGRSEIKSPRGVVWDCFCDCGGEKSVVSVDLKSGTVKSCGCIKFAGLEIGWKSKTLQSNMHTCPACGLMFQVKPSRLKKSNFVCCSMVCKEDYLKENPHLRGAYKDRSDLQKFFDEKCSRLKASAKKRSKEVDVELDSDYLLSLWYAQQGRCYYSGVRMSLDPTEQINLLSVDRKDNSKGYIKDNIVLCTYIFNSFKFNFTHEQVVKFTNEMFQYKQEDFKMKELLTQFEKMTLALAKDGGDIVKNLTPEQANLWHMATGIGGEAGEVEDVIKNHVIYQKPLDVENIKEELGDLLFYMTNLMQSVGLSFEEVLQHNVDKLSVRYSSGKYSNSQAQERADKV